MWISAREPTSRESPCFCPDSTLPRPDPVSPHLFVQSEDERLAEERRAAARVGTGSNSTPILHVEEQRKGASAKRLSSPERFEIKQLIASGAVSASDVSLVQRACWSIC